jgi:hypothetical protein
MEAFMASGRLLNFFVSATLALAILFPAGRAAAQESDQDLAKKLSNPVSDLVSVPFQFNYDHDIGPADDGERLVVNIQPVVPIGLNDNWNIISRTILPVIWQDEVAPGAGSQSGIGDILQSLFFSPKAPTAGGLIWGVGPVFLLPTGSDNQLTADKWGAGPTAVLLKQQGPWTYGALVNHIWSFAGDSDRPDVDQTYMQPFVSYTTPTAWSFTLNSESSYNWESEEWSVPINALVSKLTKIGNQRVSFQGGLRYWVDSPASGPEGVGARVTVTFLFPK